MSLSGSALWQAFPLALLRPISASGTLMPVPYLQTILLKILYGDRSVNKFLYELLLFPPKISSHVIGLSSLVTLLWLRVSLLPSPVPKSLLLARATWLLPFVTCPLSQTNTW